MTTPTAPVPTPPRLTEQELRAIDAFLSRRWSAFCEVADEYLTEDEISDLETKLSKG